MVRPSKVMAACAETNDKCIDNEECICSQIDEVELLQSMFPEPGRIQIIERIDSDSTAADDAKTYSLLLNVQVKTDGSVEVNAWAPFDDEMKVEAKETPPNTKPTFQRSMSGRRWVSSFKVNYLTPISLHVILPPSYPLRSPPDITMSCLWLSPVQLEVLCRQLDSLWGEADHMPILYTWIDWLENNALSHLRLTDSVVLTPHDDDDTTEYSRTSTECVDLGRDIGLMLRHDLSEVIAAFQQSTHLCEICFDEKPGRESVLLVKCRHSFCMECLTGFISTNVKEGTVQYLNCPDGECKSAIAPEVIKNLISEEEFERWERLLLQKTLDSMGAIQWCPRCNSLGLVDEQMDLNLAICTECQFSFCTLCRESWHQGSPCFVELKNYEARKDEVNMKRELNETEISRLREQRANQMSTSFIKSTSKFCPKCRVPIYKFDGCNKVVCSQCGTLLCWSCGKKIDGYDHFDKKCVLFSMSGDIAARNPIIQREMPERAREINEQLENDPLAVKRLVPCPRCRQRSLKEGRNNHLQCWACKCNFCAICRKRIEGSLNRHYMAGMPCDQHSDHLL